MSLQSDNQINRALQFIYSANNIQPNLLQGNRIQATPKKWVL